MTDEEGAARNAVGAKLRSRPRLDQSGPLTGQQYWVRKDSARAKVKVKASKAKTASQPLQPQRDTRSTSGLHQSPSRVSPESHRLGAVQARKEGGGRKNAECKAPGSAGRSKRWNVAYLGLLPAPQDGLSDITDIYVARYGEPRPGEKVFIVTRQQKDGGGFGDAFFVDSASAKGDDARDG